MEGGTSSEDVTHDAFLTIAKSINSIWIDSKRSAKVIPFEDRHELHHALRAIRTNLDPMKPRENPLNWLLPSYESLWRVVVRSFIEIKFARGHENPE